MVFAVSSPGWVHTIRSSYTKVIKVEVWKAGAKLIDNLPVDGGSVTWDMGSDTTVEASVSVADPAYLPKGPDDDLTPYGSSLRIYMGIMFPDNTQETVGVFNGPLVKVPTYTESGSFEIQAASWLRYVQDDRFALPWAPAAGAMVRATVTSLIQQSVPGITVTHVGGDAAVTAGLTWEEDRMAAVTDLAAAVGCIVRATPAGGILVAPEPIPNPAAVPVRVIDAGAVGILLTGSRPDLERAERYNAVAASNPDDSAVYALATLATGPEAWGGPFGRKVLFYSSPLLTAATVAQAAQTRLDTLKGRSRTLEVHMVPDPSIEIGDTIQIIWPPSAFGVNDSPTELALVRKLVLPIGLEDMTIEARGVPSA